MKVIMQQKMQPSYKSHLSEDFHKDYLPLLTICIKIKESSYFFLVLEKSEMTSDIHENKI